MSAYSALFISGRIGVPPSAALWIIEAVGCVTVVLCWALPKLDTPKKIRFTISAVIGISYSLVYSLCIYLVDSAIAFWPMTILYFIVFTALIGSDLYSPCWPLSRVKS